jgi:pimeloyl-ACP methyl ester carboxylesterase
MIKLLVVLVLGYGGICALLYFGQSSLLFPGARRPSVRLDQPRKPERLELKTPDGHTLRGMLFAANSEPNDGTADLVIGYGGNAQDAEILGQDLAARLPDADVVVFHYRGFGPSTGQPGEAALLADAVMVHDAVVAGLQPTRTFAVGISLGSSLATYVSKQRQLAGILLVTPFDSIEAIAKEQYFWIPVDLLLRHRFRSIDSMRANPTPTAVIAVEGDRVVRAERTEALRQALLDLVFDRTLTGASHATVYELPAYDLAFREAFDALRRTAAM